MNNKTTDKKQEPLDKKKVAGGCLIIVVGIALIVFLVITLLGDKPKNETNAENSIYSYTIKREWKPNNIKNSLGLDIVLTEGESKITKDGIVTFLNDLSKDKSVVSINVCLTEEAHEENINGIYGSAFKKGFLLVYDKNITEKGSYAGLNEIRWMQEEGKFADLLGTVTSLNSGHVENEQDLDEQVLKYTDYNDLPNDGDNIRDNAEEKKVVSNRIVNPLLAEFKDIKVEKGKFLLKDNEIRITGIIEGNENINHTFFSDSGIYTALEVFIISDKKVKWQQSGLLPTDEGGGYLKSNDKRSFILIRDLQVEIKKNYKVLLLAYTTGGFLNDKTADRGIFAVKEITDLFK